MSIVTDMGLTQQDLTNIHDWVVRYEVDRPLDMEVYLKPWAQNKVFLRDTLLNGQLIQKQETCFEMGEEELCHDMWERLKENQYKSQKLALQLIFWMCILEYPREMGSLSNEELKTVIHEASYCRSDSYGYSRSGDFFMGVHWGDYWNISDKVEFLLSEKVLVQNRCDRTVQFNHIYPSVDEKEKMEEMVIFPGEKPIKAIKHLVNYLQKISQVHGYTAFLSPEWVKDISDEIEEIRLAQSQVLNKKKVKGTLCLSIHPLDYMTMSDNSCNWHSCMNWTHKGDYHAGTIGMMNSPSVVMAYIESKTPYLPFGKYDGRTWSNKKWRELFIVDEVTHTVTGVRGYPYDNPGLEAQIIKMIKEKLPADWNLSDKVIPVDECGGLYYESGIMYNDVDNGNGRMIVPKSWINEDGRIAVKRRDYTSATINYSGPVYCIECGAIMDYDYNNDPVGSCSCISCQGLAWCDGCEEWVPENEINYTDDGDYCSYCYENYYRNTHRDDEDEEDENED